MNTSSAAQRFADLGSVVVLAAGYYLAGRLGLALAIPPGYATAVWPASGIALAGLLMARGSVAWMGVWLGSVVVNLEAGLDASSQEALLTSLLVPMVIASGATVQAITGQWLIRRWVGMPTVLQDDTRTILMLLVGGPLCCIISASVGVSALASRGLIPAENIPFNWWTWWVGDTIGVLIFTPLLLIWLQGPLSRRVHRKIQISLIMASFFTVVVALFIYSSRQEVQRLERDFERITTDAVTRFQRDVRDDWQALYSVADFMREGRHPGWLAFESFASGQLSRIAGVKSLSWIPVVPHGERREFEEFMRSQGFNGYAIREFGQQGGLVEAAVRPFYAPVAYIVPRKDNERALGLDDESEAVRADALARARNTGKPAASSAITLAQDGVTHRGMLLAVAAQHANSKPNAAPLGYAIAAIRNDALIEASLGGVASRNLQLRVFEGEQRYQIYGPRDPVPKDGMSRVLPVDVGGVQWHIHFHWTADYLVAQRSWQAWSVLAAGMLFAGLLGMFLLIIIGRGEHVQQLVEERTAELAREVQRSAKLEREAWRHAQDLESSNRELEQFAYAVSHDLQAPLRGISSFSRLLEKNSASLLDQRGQEFLGLIRSSAADMGRLIEDLLALSRVSAQRAEMGLVRTWDAANKACDLLRGDIEASSAVIEKGTLPEVRGDARLLTQLFQNLIGNGLKFHRQGVSPRIRLHARMEGEEWLFTVEDNGIGIAPEHVPRLFQIFKRLHTQDQYPGSGIGLALCRKIVTLHGGRIWMESEPGTGTKVCFTLVPVRTNDSAPGSALED